MENIKPILKWAGGKTQLLNEILPKIPRQYNNYIEPFLGGGALFFAIQPEHSIIADSNPELVNVYKTIASNVNAVIEELEKYKNTEDFFYVIRKLDYLSLSDVEAAARTIFLNRTCFNGLFRVNKSGNFNVPYGHYKNPKILDKDTLLNASSLLRKSKILCGDYKEILLKYAKENDFIFLDPPYLPISEYSDFKRYTKEQFYEEDHIELAEEVNRLHELGCHVILTNSNHPLVHDLYKKFQIEVIKTKRYISCRGKERTGEDVIVTVPPKQQFSKILTSTILPEQMAHYPTTRFMGSKNKLLSEIWAIASQFKFDMAIDLFSGSGIVGYMFKTQNKSVISNDYMAMSYTFAKAMIENNDTILSNEEALALINPQKEYDNFVEKKFKGLYFTDDENRLIDTIRSNIKLLQNEYKREIAMAALIRACLKKRPRGVFTYTGDRYNDGRKDLLMSFSDQFFEAVQKINKAVFNNNKFNKARNGDAMTFKNDIDGLVYIDPPYYSPLSDNEYVRRYHFVEGLARDWNGVEIQENTITKKFKSYPTPFSSRKGAADAFSLLFKKFQKNIILVSYSSNSLPTLDEMVAILANFKKHVEVVPVDYKYSFGNQNHKIGDNKNNVKEYIFVGY